MSERYITVTKSSGVASFWTFKHHNLFAKITIDVVQEEPIVVINRDSYQAKLKSNSYLALLIFGSLLCQQLSKNLPSRERNIAMWPFKQV